MDIDRCFIYALTREGKPALQRAREHGIDADILQGSAKLALVFICEYAEKYGCVPGLDLVVAETGQPFEEVTAPADFFIEKILDRRLHNRIQDSWKSAEQSLAQFRPRDAITHLEQLLATVRKDRLVATRVENLFSLGPEVIAFYDRIKSGEKGILSPWPTMNEVTLGFWPEDLVIFAARPGVGKTWVTIHLADAAWRAGYRILYVTTEMSKIRIASRFYSVHYRLPYKQLRHARLGAYAEATFRKQVLDLVASEGFDLIGGDFDFHMDSLSAAIEEVRPHIMFIDGVYLLRTNEKGESRVDRAAFIFNELKRMAKRLKIPIIVTSQFNRQATQGKALSGALATEKLALTDTAGWNADLIFGLAQTEDMRRDKKLSILCLKSREGEGEEVEVYWDFDTMNFSEIPKDPASRSADDYGTGFVPSGLSAPDDNVPF